jgi:hypothetical protein
MLSRLKAPLRDWRSAVLLCWILVVVIAYSASIAHSRRVQLSKIWNRATSHNTR